MVETGQQWKGGMGTMKPIDELLEKLRGQFTDLRVMMDPPLDEAGVWWADLDLNGHPATVEWRPSLGFGISSSDDSVFGQGSDEIYPDVESASRRLYALLMGRERTQPPTEIALAKLRKVKSISQEDLAERLQVKQAAISRLENRPDSRISTIRATIEALGGELELRARFPDGVYTLEQPETQNPPRKTVPSQGK